MPEKPVPPANWPPVDPAGATPELVRAAFRHLPWGAPGGPKELIYGICESLDGALAEITSLRGEQIVLEPCADHVERQHRDRKPPWCDTCGWNRGRPASPPVYLRGDTDG